MDTSEINQYLDKMRDVQKTLLTFLEDETAGNFEQFIELINNKIDRNSKIEMKEFLHLLSKISDNHHRSLNFIDKIEIIIKYYLKEIKNNFSNYSIFNIFKKNKRLLFFLFNEKIIIPDQSIFSIISEEKYKKRFYLEYFYKEFKSFLDKNFRKQVVNNNFEEKRKIGENDNSICNLIRNDSIDEFVNYAKKNKLKPDTNIPQSIFETNLFLLKNQQITLIEYALFFGSINVIRYLMNENCNALPSFWSYAIHSGKQDVICLLEEKYGGEKFKPEIKSFEETVKCYHTNIMNYMKTKFNFNVEGVKTIFHFNFDIINNVDCFLNGFSHIFYLFCKYDYIIIVKYLMNNKIFYNDIIIIIFMSFHKIRGFIISYNS